MSTVTQLFDAASLSNAELAHLCGPMDENLRQIEAGLDVAIARRGAQFTVRGTGITTGRALRVLERFAGVAHRAIDVEEIQLAMIEMGAAQPITIDGEGTEGTVLRVRRAGLTGRTPNQRQYLQQILGHDISFGIGPAGTGKTYLAVACAVDALEREAVKRIVLTRPAVVAGERLGFLPGDLAQKVDPYLRPL
ncbi:MAG TPA: PhoH family protein, partial [Burkholderiaceae bacterium]|nr:PhoH family protein [Burkholderiaceae bacterium]